MFMESFLLFAQHVSDLTEPIIRSTTVVYAAICFPMKDRIISISGMGCCFSVCAQNPACCLCVGVCLD
jgi:hypothetical protein